MSPDRATRAQRRHDNARLKSNRKGYWGRDRQARHEAALTPRQFGLVLSAPHMAGNCPCCNRPRCRLKGDDRLPMQERRAIASAALRAENYAWPEEQLALNRIVARSA